MTEQQQKEVEKLKDFLEFMNFDGINITADDETIEQRIKEYLQIE